MRTKTLLLTAALGAAGLATSMAQVYSVNAVGYVNLTVNPGFNMYCNPLVQADTTVAALLPNPPHLTSVYKLTPTGFAQSTYDTDLGGWDDPAMTMDLGGGFFLYNNGALPFTVTFVGEVAQGTLVNNIPTAGFSMRSSKVPQTGLLTQDLGYVPNQLDSVYTFANPGGFSQSTYDTDLGGWDLEPTIAVGQAFYLNAIGPNNWVRVFSVN
jgi:hypothetical protein